MVTFRHEHRIRAGARIKEIRHQLGLTQRALAEHVGLASPASISRVESGAETAGGWVFDLAVLAMSRGISALDLVPAIRHPEVVAAVAAVAAEAVA